MTAILVIDDSEAHRSEIRGAVEAAGIFDVVLEAADGLRGLRLLLDREVDVVVCDLEMPGLDGEKLLRVKGRSPGGPNIPFVFITASTDVERKARLLDDGAADTIAKPVHPTELVARLRLHLKVKRLQDELQSKNEMLGRLSTFDALTGLRSRRFATDFLAIEFLRARRYRTQLSVVMADLDHFKGINDRFGHPGGDAVLRGVSRLLVETLRATDVAGRFGGEELIVVLPQNSGDGAVVLAERWRRAVEAEPFVSPDGDAIPVTLSAGVAQYGLEKHATPDEVVAAADRALYRAKQAGRNRVELET